MKGGKEDPISSEEQDRLKPQLHQQMSKTGVFASITNIHRDELVPVLLSGACFFFLLFGYFLLRPLREAMGVERSMGDLRWLFLITCGVSLVVSLAFGGVVSRLDRKRCITFVYRLVMLCLVGFIVALLVFDDTQKLYSGYVFYVWLSVVNLFITSVFWAFMADIWRLEQSKRLYAMIGIGGTVGAILGSNFVWWLAEAIPTWMQITCAIVAFECAVQCVQVLDRKAGLRESAQSDRGETQAPVGGQWVDGLKAILRSPYLLGIGVYISLVAVSSTMIYFTQANLVARASDELNERVALFAQLDMWTQLATLFVQLFITAHIIKRLGVGIALALLPVVTLVGFVVLAWVNSIDGIQGWQVFAVFATFNAIHRAVRYAVIRPARETLFSVVPTDEKYKAKPIIDVFLYRGGDVAGTGVERAIAGAGLGLVGMAMFAAPLALLWGGIAWGLAISQSKRAKSLPDQSGHSSGHDHDQRVVTHQSADTGTTTGLGHKASQDAQPTHQSIVYEPKPSTNLEN